ncbi:MAG: hypothetical protein ABFD08_04520 [Syntrophomonas sp.]
MKSKTILVLLISVLSVIILGLSIVAIRLLGSSNIIPALLVITGSILLITISFKALKRAFGDLKEGIPINDERSSKIRMYAAGYSYFISIYIWLILLVFQKYLDRDDILTTGLLGMAISFWLCWAIFSKRKGFE